MGELSLGSTTLVTSFKNTPAPYADLGEIIAGQKPGREAAGERIICINIGLALDDMATALSVHPFSQPA